MAHQLDPELVPVMTALAERATAAAEPAPPRGDNLTARSAVLGEDLGTPAVSPIAAPARLADHRGLAPAYLDVGDLDIFRNEDLSYGRSLALAGAPVEFHPHPGAPHGWEHFAPYAGSARRALADRARVISAL